MTLASWLGCLKRAMVCASLAGLSFPAWAADYPAPKEADWVARDFKFHTGEAMPELKLHYATVGAASGEPVLVLHGTTGSSASMLTPAFAGELFGPGQPLDAQKYFLIIPDALGHGKSAKPSDGMRELKRVKNGRLHLIPASEDTSGHGTTGRAKFYAQALQQLLQSAPRRP